MIRALLFLGLTCEIFAKSHVIEGMIVKVDAVDRILTISHREIPGYMPAMTMPFSVGGKSDLGHWKPGQRVRATLVVDSKATRLTHIQPMLAAKPEFPIPQPKHALVIGESVADFRLTDQAKRSFNLSDTRGKVTVVDFIYTRCPLPEVCPRLTAAFAAAQRRFSPDRVSLLSITLDPVYDTPEVLAAYATRSGAKLPQWRFLTGTMAEVAEVAGQFGMVYWPEEGTLTHNSRTVIINQTGHIAAIIDGSSFRLRELADVIASLIPAEAR